ncbi:MAG: hopanoid-associated sugar epimerase [Burkholderiaceae bacterium]
MTTLVTGAAGFVGSAVVRELLKAGHAVRVLTRPTSDPRNLHGLPIDIVHGDLTNRASLDHAAKGCEALFHVAADYRLWVPNPPALYQANVQGTLNMLLAAANAGVGRMVYTSSVATLGLNADSSPAHEDTPVTLADMVGHYKRSKFLAEQEVQRLVREHGLAVVTVNPSTPIGPRDVKPTPTGRLIVDAAAGRMPAYVDTGLNLVHVDDVAVGHRLAFEHGVVGERYILGGNNMTLRQILESVAQITGRPAPKVRLPHNLVLPIAYLAETWARLVPGHEPMATVDGVRLSRKRMFFSAQKAERVLGLTTRPVQEALSEAIAWFRQNGYCP